MGLALLYQDKMDEAIQAYKKSAQIQVLAQAKIKKIKSCETIPKLLRLIHQSRVAAIEPHVPGPGFKKPIPKRLSQNLKRLSPLNK